MGSKMFCLTVHIPIGGLLDAVHIFKMTKEFLSWKRNIKQVCYGVKAILRDGSSSWNPGSISASFRDDLAQTTRKCSMDEMFDMMLEKQ